MKSYEHFLVSELIFQRDRLQFHTLPQISQSYDENFGNLEDRSDRLNLNIRILRRKIELLERELSLKEIENVIKEEFHSQERALEEKQSNALLPFNLPFLSREEKEEQDHLYRKLIFSSAPQLYHLSKKEQDEFYKMRRAYSCCDIQTLRSYSFPKRKSKSLCTLQWEQLKETLQVEISQLYLTFPLNQQAMLEDEQAKAFNYERLQNLIKEYSLLYRHLEEEFHLRYARQIMKKEAP